jgi:FAD/FMN-containing dehydrogenase
MKITRREFVAAGAAAVALPTAAAARQRVILNDASGLNPTPVAKHVIAPDGRDAFIKALRDELREAAQTGRPVALGAARHSMGGQSLARDGTAITLPPSPLIPNAEAGTYTAGFGTRWSDVVPTLDAIGFSPVVMQSNNDFGVASTFSVNAHGWAVPHGPMGSTVKSVEMMLADGTLLRCSREENGDLFRAAMGGYGLLGIVVSLDVEMVPNSLLRGTVKTLPAGEFADEFLRAAPHTSGTRMAYGRLSVSRRDFLDEAMLVTFHEQDAPGDGMPPMKKSNIVATVSRGMYRAQVGSDTAKLARWSTEKLATPRMFSRPITRNSLLNAPVSNLANTDPSRTDILHEYFVRPELLVPFLDACREVIPRHGQELLNVTLRYVGSDQTSVLAYAPSPRIAAVMSFSQLVTPSAEAAMIRMTEELIDRVNAIGGSFYLPYRLHARRDQVEKAYPRLAEFASLKRQYDPNLRFRNLMWDAYLS